MTAIARQRAHARERGRLLLLLGFVLLAFTAIAGQLLRLAIDRTRSEARLAAAEPVTQTFARPDIVDRHGRLLAADVLAPSLFADPALIVDPDEAADHLAAIFPELDARLLRGVLADRNRRFVWIRRGLPPRLAQHVHDLGLPGLAFRYEPRRTYPGLTSAAHVLGFVGADNQGLAGLERAIDERQAAEATLGAEITARQPLRTSLDLGVQHGLEAELADAVSRYSASGAAGVILDAQSGEILAAASLPAFDPALEPQVRTPAMSALHADRLSGGTYELGSIFKAATIAMALDEGFATLDTVYDVRVPLTVGPYRIRDHHAQGRPLSVRDIFVHSSNVGAGMMALQAGARRQRAFLDKLGLISSMRTEAGPVAPPHLPKSWGKAETITIAYGHGMAVAPLQFAAAGAALVNGGTAVKPTFIAGAGSRRERVISEATSMAIRDLMRRNVVSPRGTGRRADVPGLEIGGKTGTAEIPMKGGYSETAVISSFFAAFPMSAPRYVALVLLFEPKPGAESKGQVGAGLTAAPVAGRLIARVAPLLESALPR